jgi:tRNA (Thr-GGU) A37 N-methylase
MTMLVIILRQRKKKKSSKIESTFVKLLGLDLVDGTPVYDIKPYIPFGCILSQLFHKITS